MVKGLLMFGALLMATPVLAQTHKDAPPAPAEPDWTQVRKGAEAALRANLLDPQSAQFEWAGGWRWGHVKPFELFSKRTFGWLGCVTLNAKNRMGGYVGGEAHYVLLTPQGRFLTGRVVEVTSQCDLPNSTPLQAAFIDSPASNAVAATSVADELAKLAELRDKGVITPAEFDTQKAKLLAR